MSRLSVQHLSIFFVSNSGILKPELVTAAWRSACCEHCLEWEVWTWRRGTGIWAAPPCMGLSRERPTDTGCRSQRGSLGVCTSPSESQPNASPASRSACRDAGIRAASDCWQPGWRIEGSDLICAVWCHNHQWEFLNTCWSYTRVRTHTYLYIVIEARTLWGGWGHLLRYCYSPVDSQVRGGWGRRGAGGGPSLQAGQHHPGNSHISGQRAARLPQGVFWFLKKGSKRH